MVSPRTFMVYVGTDARVADFDQALVTNRRCNLVSVIQLLIDCGYTAWRSPHPNGTSLQRPILLHRQAKSTVYRLWLMLIQLSLHQVMNSHTKMATDVAPKREKETSHKGILTLVGHRMEKSGSHGIPNISRAQTTIRKLSWSLLFIAGLVMFLYQSYFLINKYVYIRVLH